MRRVLLAIAFIAFFFSFLPRSFGQSNQTVVNGGTTTAVNFAGSGCTYSWQNSNPAIGIPASGTGNIPSYPAVNNSNSPVTATITATPAESGFIFASNPYTNKVAVINATTNSVISYVQVGTGPSALSVSPDGSRLYVVNTESASVSVINTSTDQVISTVQVGSYPYGVVVSPDGSTVYVANQVSNSVSVINAITNTVTSTITLTKSGPWGISISPDGANLFLTDYNSNSILIINTANKIIKSVTVGTTPIGITPSSKANLVYVANFGSGNVSVVNVLTNTVIATIPVGSAPMGITMSSDGTRIYVTNSASNSVSVIDATTNKVISTISVGQTPEGISVSADGSLVYVFNTSDNTMSVINTSNNLVSATSSVNNGQYSIGNFVSGCSPVKFTITVNPTPASPVISTATATGTITACQGTASTSPNVQQFTVSGSNLTTGVTAQAPPGFEVSLTAISGYSNSVVLNQSSGSIGSAIVYVRSAAGDAVGHVSGNVVLSSIGAANQTVAVSGTINALPTANLVPDQTLKSGASTTAINFTGKGNTFTWTNDTPSIGLAGSGTGSISSFTAVNTGSSPITANITATPTSDGYMYIPNTFNNTLEVINTTTGVMVANIPTQKYPIGVSVSPDGTRVYVSDQNPGGQSSVSVINTSTNTLISNIPIGTGAWGIVTSPDGKWVYVANENSNNVSVINTATNTLYTNITIPAGAVGIAISSDGSRVYVGTSYKSSTYVAVINTATNAVLKNITVGGSLWGLAISPDGSRVYAADPGNNTVSVINTLTGQVMASVPVGNFPTGVVVSPDNSKVYVTNVNGNTISVIDAASDVVIATIGGQGPQGVSISPDGNYLYVVNTGSNSVGAYDTQTNTLIKTLSIGQSGNSQALGNFLTTGTNCSGAPINFKITVTASSAAAVITAGQATGNISACVGTASASPNIQQFTVSATNLNTAVTATAPAGFEVSLAAGSGYSTSVTINQLAGSISNTTVYVRSAGGDGAGNISGNVVLSSAGAANQLVAVSGVINSIPAVDAVTSQTFVNGVITTPFNFTGTANTFSWVNDTPGIGTAVSGYGDIPPFTAINTGTKSIVATVTVTPMSYPLAYIANGDDGTVSVINTVTSQVVATIKVGAAPTGVSVSPDNKTVYVADDSDNTISVINTATNTVTNTITVGLNPQSLMVTPDGKEVYILNTNGSNVSILNTATNTITKTIQLSAKPVGVAISKDGSRLYLTDLSNNVEVINTATNTVIAIIPVGQEPICIAVSPNGKRVYTANYNSGYVSVIDASTNTVVQNITVGGGPEGVAVSADGSFVYITNRNSNTVSVINTATNTVVQTINVDQGPAGIALNSDGSLLYVEDIDSHDVSIINTSTNSIVSTVQVGTRPISVGNFIQDGGGCNGIPAIFTITVNPSSVPVITAGTATGNITACEGTASATPNIQQITVSGNSLTAGITATAPVNFEVSLNATTGFSNSLTLTQSSGTVSSTSIYVRSSATAQSGNISGAVVLTSTGAANQSVAVSGMINAIPTADAVSSQTFVNGAATTPFNFTGTANSYNWVNNAPGIGLAASGTGDIAPFTPTNNTANPVTATIMVTPLNSTNCSGGPITFTITVNPKLIPATLTATSALTPLTTVYGTPSPAEGFTVSGTNITSGILVSPPAGFEVSSDGTGFNATATINGTGNISSAQVAIRLTSATPVGTYSGNIVLSTANAASINVVMPASTVTPATLTIKADNKTKPYGAVNPPLTLTYSGFVNNDGPAQLTAQPDVTTIAVTQSAVGEYPIVVAPDASSPNYTFSYVDGLLTIEPALLVSAIPNVFTPNGDGINEAWLIPELAYYPKSTVNVFSRWGQKVYSSIGYPIPWDGTCNGNALPSGTYYYVIDPKNGQAVIAGWVAIIR